MIKVARFLFFYVFILPALVCYRKYKGTNVAWVIGGHGGKAYADNSASLHKYIVNETEQPVVWITKNRQVERALTRENQAVYRKDSLTARLAIMSAPVLIRSHGDADLDSVFGKYIKPAGLVIHLNHSMNHIKAGQMFNPKNDKMSQRQRDKIEKKIFYFDYLLASSPLEQKNFQLSIPSKADRIILGGGAHLDGSMNGVKNSAELETILYFPTWREKSIKCKKTLDKVIAEIVSNSELINWLEESNCKLVVCLHINLKKSVDNFKKSKNIDIVSTDDLQKNIQNCTLFISDYSGAIIDALYLGKPVIFYPYDIEEYLKSRNLYVKYDEFAFGPIVHTVEELVNCVKNKKNWVNDAEYINKRESHYNEMFPYGNKGYAQRSYNAICHLLEGKDPKKVK